MQFSKISWGGGRGGGMPPDPPRRQCAKHTVGVSPKCLTTLNFTVPALIKLYAVHCDMLLEASEGVRLMLNIYPLVKLVIK